MFFFWWELYIDAINLYDHFYHAFWSSTFHEAIEGILVCTHALLVFFFLGMENIELFFLIFCFYGLFSIVLPFFTSFDLIKSLKSCNLATHGLSLFWKLSAIILASLNSSWWADTIEKTTKIFFQEFLWVLPPLVIFPIILSKRTRK